jgi:chemotaxis protein MotB
MSDDLVIDTPAEPGTEGAETPTERRRRRGKPFHAPAGGHDDGEGNWLVSYADMMTLLFGFFVIMTAFSTPDAAKVEKLKQETAKSMNVKYENPYENLTLSVGKVVKDFSLDKEIKMEETGDGIALIFRGTLFFDSGSAILRQEASNVVSKIAELLAPQSKGFKVIVEGHTDDAPIVSKTFPSNWELSSARASSVVRLLETKGFEHKMLRPLGLADTEPLLPNHDASGAVIQENRAQNRRIVIRLQKNLPSRSSKGEKPAVPARGPGGGARGKRP